MADSQQNAVLAGLLIDLSRSMLQYVGECWPWTGDNEGERRTIEELVARQQRAIARLVELLDRRRWPIHFGTYPGEFTDLHYLALEHLLGRLIEQEEALIEEIGRAASDCRGDDEAVALIEQIEAEERENLDRLKSLAREHTAGSAA